MPGTPEHDRLLTIMVMGKGWTYESLVEAGYDTHVLVSRGDEAEGGVLIAEPEISQMVVDQVNKYQEVTKEGLRYELGSEGKVVKKRISVAIEQEY